MLFVAYEYLTSYATVSISNAQVLVYALHFFLD